MAAPSEKTALLHLQQSGADEPFFDDIVTLNYKNMGYVWIQCSFWWMLGLSLSVADHAYPEASRWHHEGSRWLVLIGTLWGLTGCGLVLREVLLHTNIMLDDSLHRLQRAGVNVSRTHIAYSSFPLMRLLLCLVGVSMAALILFFISEVLCAWRCSEGPSAALQALIPVLLFVAGAAAFMTCLKTIPLALSALVVLVAAQVVIFIIKFNGDSDISWEFALFPYWIILGGFLVEILRILAKRALGHHLSMTAFRYAQLAGMSLAIYLGALACLSISGVSTFGGGGGLFPFTNPWMGWLVSVWLLYLSLSVSFLSHCILHANRRGYIISPLHVERTNLGWEPVPSREQQRSCVLIV